MLAATLPCTLIVAAPASSGSTTNDATLGAALAWELGEELRVGAIDEAHAIMRVGELSPVELRKFLSAWAMAAPPIDVAVRVRLEAERRLAEPASVEVEPREPEPGGLKDPPPQADTAPPPPEFPNVEDAAARAWARDAKSPARSVLLSVFIGFGAGNFYAERYTYGAVVGAVQVLGGIAMGFGVIRGQVSSGHRPADNVNPAHHAGCGYRARTACWAACSASAAGTSRAAR